MDQPAIHTQASTQPGTQPSIIDLPSIVLQLYERAQQPLSVAGTAQIGLFVRYLRRKAERGLAVIYAVDNIRRAHTAHSHTQRTVSLTLDEQALDGARIRFSLEDVQQAALTILPSGVLEASTLGLSVQAFPADSHLTALAASCDTNPSGPVFTALQTAARTQLRDSTWQLLAATAEPVRYKPSNRCVNRYHLMLQHPQEGEKHLTIFGKVYADPQQAQTVQALQQQLYDEQAQQAEIPLLPRPLALIESLGLAFNEAVQPAPSENATHDTWSSLRTGTRSLQPNIEHSKGGVIARLLIPEEELRLTAQALARLHTSKVQPPQNAPRTGAKEARRALERAGLIAGWYSGQAAQVQQLAKELAARLSAAVPEAYRPAHGGFKASQLLFHSHRVFVVDFDGFCLADPALDVGYFLAYLRPSGLWYARPGMRQWFEQAATLFRNTYHEAMAAQGVASASIDDIIERSRLYEAALIFKIATRRVNRLNSPRPQELSLMLQEITTCLTGNAKGDV
jgi:hypothetical protein